MTTAHVSNIEHIALNSNVIVLTINMRVGFVMHSDLLANKACFVIFVSRIRNRHNGVFTSKIRRMYAVSTQQKHKKYILRFPILNEFNNLKHASVFITFL